MWTPAKSAAERLPVFFWIHGGGYNSGSGSVALYDGAAMTRRGIVVVNINYRLASFGFLAHPELSGESPSAASGSYAIADMIAALGWVRDNIAAFNDTPILTGYTADEGSSWSPNYGRATVAGLQQQLEQMSGRRKDEFLKIHAAFDEAAAGEMSKSIARDQTQASMYRWAADRLNTSQYPIYCYWYTHTEPGPESDRYGAFHASDLAYVFDTLDKSPGRTFTEQDRGIAKTMAGYLSNFVKTGNPNGPGLPQWPPLDRTDKQIMELGDAFQPRPILTPEKLALFEAHDNRQP